MFGVSSNCNHEMIKSEIIIWYYVSTRVPNVELDFTIVWLELLKHQKLVQPAIIFLRTYDLCNIIEFHIQNEETTQNFFDIVGEADKRLTRQQNF